MGYCATVSAQRILRLFGREFGDLALVDFLGFLDTQAYMVLSLDSMDGDGCLVPIALLKFSIKASVFLTSAE